MLAIELRGAHLVYKRSVTLRHYSLFMNYFKGRAHFKQIDLKLD